MARRSLVHKKMEHTPELEPAVQFSSKELFLEVNRKIDDVLKVLNQKADRIEHDKVEAKVEEILRDGTPLTHKIELEMKELDGKFQTLERQSASTGAVTAATQRIEASEHDTKMQWVAIGVTFFFSLATLIVGVVSLFKK